MSSIGIRIAFPNRVRDKLLRLQRPRLLSLQNDMKIQLTKQFNNEKHRICNPRIYRINGL